jgi:hypothetical protein
VEAGFENSEVAAKRLLDAQLGSLDLIDWAIAAAANARTPYFETAGEGAATFQTRLITGALEFLCLEILEIFFIALLNLLVVGVRHFII